MLKKSLIIFSGLLIILAIGVVYKVHSNLEEMEMDTRNIIIHRDDDEDIKQRDKERETKVEDTVTQTEKEPEDFYTLMIGLDYRENFFSLNTDSIIIAHVIPQNKSMKLISLPRDLKIVNLREQVAKVNSVFNDGYQHALQEGRKDPSVLSGRKVSMGSISIPEEYMTSGSVVLRETIEKYLDINIEYTFLVNFQTVISLVDEIGGIEINVDRSMQYDDPTDGTHIHLEKGIQVLDGQDALNFARFREDNRGPGFFSNDFERGDRQKQVITKLADDLSSWSNVTRIFNLLDIVSANFKTDMSKTKMISLINEFHGHLDRESIISIPFTGYWKSPYVDISEEKLDKLISDFTSIEAPVDTAVVQE
jgi:LCP family protein required for cell wall assembly